ncbi:SRPBCC family protein [Dyella subtropica]|uniref:SRPBCC family protein n=1 Tax=Dyella subtropica TaxID=2992127 RepID=UPI00225597C8|nr:SRPBCC family protein [Dyella subtropica]
MNDYGVVTAPGTMRFERLLPGPIERVWSYLIDSDKRRQWLAAGTMELRVGGQVEHVFRHWELTGNDSPPPAKYAKHADTESRMHGHIIASEPPHLLAYTWGETEDDGQPAADSEVRFELTPQGDNVLFVLTHSRLPNHDYMIGVASGWHTHLSVLSDLLSGHRPTGFWNTFARMEAAYLERIPADSATPQ